MKGKKGWKEITVPIILLPIPRLPKKKEVKPMQR